MRICIKFDIDDPKAGRRTFVRHTDRDYPAVPRAGDAVTPDDTGQLAPRHVTRVVYEPDGRITLELDPGLPTTEPDAFIMMLETVGFEEMPQVHLP